MGSSLRLYATPHAPSEGQDALYARLELFHALWDSRACAATAYVAFYPDCMTAYISDTDVVSRLIRIFGVLDDYNPISKCGGYVERLRVAGHDAELTEYQRAHLTILGAQLAIMPAQFQSVCNSDPGGGR